MVKIYDIYEPYLTGKDSHGSTLTELPDGRIMVVWYSGTAEKHKDVGIFQSFFDRKTEKWTAPELLEKESQTKSEGNPVIYYDEPTKRLWLFWVTMDRADAKWLKGGWSTCKMKCKHSDDVGKTWTPARYLTKTWGKMVRNKPIRMSNGNVLLPIYTEWLGYKSNYMICTAESFAKGSQLSEWKKVGPYSGGILQPTVVELEPGHLLSYNRTERSGKFGGWITAHESFDYGNSWGKTYQAPLRNPNGGTDMVKLRNGKIALAFNNSSESRNPLSIGVSSDNGKTWPKIIDIENTPGERFGYPAIIQTKDGVVYCSYTNTRGQGIRVAKLDESELN
jgi:predicted neuraminidase